MADDRTMHRSTEGMVDYNANSRAQQQNAFRNADVITELAARVAGNAERLMIADYGCGPGQSTIETVRPALEVWRKAAPDKPLSVCHADQPGNDWNALARLVYSENGYAAGSDAPLVLTSVGSFYDRMLPDASVSIATCFFASHWLRDPVQLFAPETLWFADLAGDARVQMWKRAQSDWVRFLKLRAEELQPGGYLYVSALGAVPETGEINGTAAAGRTLYRAMQEVANGMVEDGLLDRDVAARFVFGLWFLTAREARVTIETHAEVKDLFDIDTVDVIRVEDGDIFASSLEDPDEYARQYAGYTRAFAASTLRTHLFHPSAGSDDQALALEQEFFKRYEALYRLRTKELALEQWLLKAILRRR